jgi:dephospho-CoA kinase
MDGTNHRVIVGLCGLIGSGKDTFANYLVEKYDFVKVSFASALKDALCAVFGWDRQLIEGDTKESRAWRNTVDEWWSKRLGIADLTPRKMLQFWGTDLCRRMFHNEIWIASLQRKIEQLPPNKNVVVCDCRFSEEIELINSFENSVVVKIERNIPHWEHLAQQAADGRKEAIQLLTDVYEIHESEWRVWCCKADIIVKNQGTLHDFYQSIEFTLGYLMEINV